MSFVTFLFDLFGRVRRRDFWLFFFACALVYTQMFRSVLHVADVQEDVALASVSQVYKLLSNQYLFTIFFVMQLATLAIIVRRWHDRDKSGLWTLVALFPVLGQVWLVVELGFLPGSSGTNRFGPSPRAETRTL